MVIKILKNYAFFVNSFYNSKFDLLVFSFSKKITVLDFQLRKNGAMQKKEGRILNMQVVIILMKLVGVAATAKIQHILLQLKKQMVMVCTI